MTRRRVIAIAALLAALVAGAVLLLQWPLEQALVLAPVMVATVGATAFIVVLWIKIAYESLSAQRHPFRIVGAGLAALAALVVLSFFVDLPATH